MKNAFTILVFTVAVTLFYNYVGQLVPQKEVYPPKEVAVSAEMTTEQMVEAGKQIVQGKGTCMNCHNGNKRFPVFDGIGAAAKTRKEGMSDVDYLAEALYEPNTFIVPPFAAGMPPVAKPPIGLTDQEILTVIAYLQSLGGTPTVTMTTKLKYQGQSGSGDSAAATSAPAGGAAAPSNQTGEQLMATWGCTGCHKFDSAEKLVGPGLGDVGKRMNKAQLYEALMDPEGTIAEGYMAGMMGPTLEGTGFYKKTTSEDLRKMVDYLASLKGKK